ncbi:MAG: TetR/AcrR family transcriptional regulator C-terminal domain-containing protein [Jiangellaceae bacterium]
MDLVISVVLGFVQGMARSSVDAAEAERRTGMTDEQWWRAYGPLMSQRVDPTAYPTATRVGSAAGAEYGAGYDPRRAFEFGLQRVLDGVEALVRSRSQS